MYNDGPAKGGVLLGRSRRTARAPVARLRDSKTDLSQVQQRKTEQRSCEYLTYLFLNTFCEESSINVPCFLPLDMEHGTFIYPDEYQEVEVYYETRYFIYPILASFILDIYRTK